MNLMSGVVYKKDIIMCKEIKANTPAIPSSNMTPKPPGKAVSAHLTGQGLAMSNSLKSRNAKPRLQSGKAVKKSRASHCPNSSSTITEPGSFLPITNSARLQAQTPMMNTNASMMHRPHSGKGRKSQGAATTAASDPQVPGALGKCPTGPSVAMASANLSEGSEVFMSLPFSFYHS